MKNEDRYDGLIRELTLNLFPACDWLLIKAQVAQESSFDPNAESPCGALGLLQVMPATASQLFGLSKSDLLGPATNLDAGIRYLRIQYIRLPEIPSHDERLKFALASYNAGRGYINKALKLAYLAETGTPMPAGHKGAAPGKWQTWNFTKAFFNHPDCLVAGKHPDWRQVTEYVDRIWPRYERYKTL